MCPIHPRFRGVCDVSLPRRVAVLCGLSIGIAGCMPPTVGAQPARVPSMNLITEISLERDCFGCASGWVLVLRRDGTAQRTLRGNSRRGTVDQVSTGTLRLSDFQALADVVEARRFFALADEFRDPEIQDGPWTQLRVVRGAQAKQVFRQDGIEHAGLMQIEARIDAVAVRLGLGFEPR